MGVESGRQSFAGGQLDDESLLELVVIVAVLGRRGVCAGFETEAEVVAGELVEVVEGVLGQVYQVLCLLGL